MNSNLSRYPVNYIQPWKTVRQEILELVTLLSRKKVKVTSSSQNMRGFESKNSSKYEISSRRSLTSAELTPLGSKNNIVTEDYEEDMQVPLALPHGFRLLRTLHSQKATMSQCLYSNQGNVDVFYTLDSTSVSIWKGNKKYKSLSTHIGDRKGGAKESSVAGLCRWTYVKKWRCILAGNLQLQLKILDNTLNEVSCVHSLSPVLSLEFVDETEELLVGTMGGIRVWTFKVINEMNKVVRKFASVRLFISDLTIDDWVTALHYNHQSYMLFAACSNSVYVYSFRTGNRLYHINNGHELSITGLLFFADRSYLVTSSQDHTIKIWNKTSLLYTFKEHLQCVSSIILPSPGSNLPNDTAFFISCSKDGSVCLWNADTGKLAYKIETHSEWLGMNSTDRESFYTYNADGLSVWTISQSFSSYCNTFSQVNLLERISPKTSVSKVLTATQDGSLRFISPVSGSVLTTGFPIIKDVQVLSVVYQEENEMLWVLNTHHDVLKYSCRTHPMMIINIWNFSSKLENPTCMTSVTVPYDNKKSEFCLIGGTTNGHIVQLSTEKKQPWETLILAHFGAVKSLQGGVNKPALVSLGEDNVIKVWKLDSLPMKSKTFESGSSDVPIVIQLINAMDLSPTIPVNIKLLHETFSWDNYTLIITTSLNALQILNFQYGEMSYLNHEMDEDHVNPILDVTVIEELKLIATIAEDGIVKIWTLRDNSLIRELPFMDQKVNTITFANQRGDLLLGTDKEILLIRFQNYLPPTFLRDMLGTDFDDDEVELGPVFDSELDFWELFLDDMDADSLKNWHTAVSEKTINKIKSKQIKKAAGDFISEPSLAHPSCMNNKNIQLFEHNREGSEKNTNSDADDDDDDLLLEDTEIEKAINAEMSSEAGEKYVNTIIERYNITEPSMVHYIASNYFRKKIMQEKMRRGARDLGGSRDLLFSWDDETDGIQKKKKEVHINSTEQDEIKFESDINVSKAVVADIPEPPPRPSTAKTEIKQKKMTILQKMALIGIAPNSIAMKASAPDNMVMTQKDIINNNSKDNSIESTNTINHTNYSSRSSTAKTRPSSGKFDMEKESGFLEKMKAKMLKAKEQKEQEALAKLELEVKNISLHLDEPELVGEFSPQRVFEPVLDTFIPDITNSPTCKEIVHQQETMFGYVDDKELIKAIAAKPKKHKQSMMRKQTIYQNRKASILPRPETKPKEPVQNGGLEVVGNSKLVTLAAMEVVRDKQKVKRDKNGNPIMYLHRGTIKPKTKEEKERIVQKANEALNKFRSLVDGTRDLTTFTESERRMAKCLDGKIPNAPNVAIALVSVRNQGDKKDKIEVISTITNIYQAYEDEFPNPLETLVLPQLTVLRDKDDEVREVALVNLPIYETFNMDVLYEVVRRLQDPAASVRREALKTLILFGIDTKTRLREIMAELKLISVKRLKDMTTLPLKAKSVLEVPFPQPPTRTLDVDRIERWIMNTKPKQKLERKDSFVSTLCPPPSAYIELSSLKKEASHMLLSRNNHNNKEPGLKTKKATNLQSSRSTFLVL